MQKLLGVLLVIFIASGGFVFYMMHARQVQQDAFQTLTVAIEAQPREPSAADARLQAYAQLHAENADLAGWIHIPNTNINYPVMHTPQDGEYYLRRNFAKESSTAGTPFLDANCSVSPRSDNLIVYGHHMTDGSMFADLLQYADKAFFDAHPLIEFDTLTRLENYAVVAVFTSQDEVDSPQFFPYQQYVTFENETAFAAYQADIEARALYRSEVSFTAGDALLTLSTCEYSQENGRLVVIAKRVDA